MMRLHSMVCAALGGAALMAAPREAFAVSNGAEITAVSARASDDYVRARLANGTLQPEYYSFGEGGHWTGSASDASIDRLKFIDVARTIAGPLRDQNFIPTLDAKSAKLLILVYWGTTRAPGSTAESEAVENLQNANANLGSAKGVHDSALQKPNANSAMSGANMICGRVETTTNFEAITDKQDAESQTSGALAVVAAENGSRDQINMQNATMLGFDKALGETASLVGTPLEHRRAELVAEIEHQRYFVVLMAYDFQLMWKQKKHKLLWETRYSVPEIGKNFDGYLLAMTKRASQYFGRNSVGLVHLDLPEGRVDVGDVKSLGTVAER